MREGLLVVYHLPPGSSNADHNRFRWRVHGRDTSSWGGKYAYHRPGFLDGVPHVLLYTGIVILRPVDGPAFLEIVKAEGGEAVTRRVLLERGDQRSLTARRGRPPAASGGARNSH